MFITEELQTWGDFSGKIQWLVWDEFVGSVWTVDQFQRMNDIYAHKQLFSRHRLKHSTLLHPWLEKRLRNIISRYETIEELKLKLSEYPEDPPLESYRKQYPLYQEYELRVELTPEIIPWITWPIEKGRRVVSKPNRYGVCSNWGRLCDSYTGEALFEVPIGFLEPVE